MFLNTYITLHAVHVLIDDLQLRSISGVTVDFIWWMKYTIVNNICHAGQNPLSDFYLRLVNYIPTTVLVSRFKPASYLYSQQTIPAHIRIYKMHCIIIMTCCTYTVHICSGIAREGVGSTGHMPCQVEVIAPATLMHIST